MGAQLNSRARPNKEPPCSVSKHALSRRLTSRCGGAWLQVERGPPEHLNRRAEQGPAPFQPFLHDEFSLKVAQAWTDLTCMTPLQIQTELNKIPAALSVLERERRSDTLMFSDLQRHGSNTRNQDRTRPIPSSKFGMRPPEPFIPANRKFLLRTRRTLCCRMRSIAR
jgi:hypothetical protein